MTLKTTVRLIKRKLLLDEKRKWLFLNLKKETENTRRRFTHT